MRQLAIGLMGLATIVILFRLNNAGGEAGHLGGAILGFILMKSGLLSHYPHAFHRPPPSHHDSSHLREDTEIDAILDKISREGLHSLTDEERERLRKSAE